MAAQGRYRKGTGIRFDIALCNLSEYGCQFADLVGRLQVGDEITVRIGDIGPVPACVKWVTRRQCGIEFEEPLHPSVLGHIVARERRERARRKT